MAKAKKPEPSTQILRITSAIDGFRRAGRAWSKTPIDVALADLTEEQIALLEAEPMLNIVELTGAEAVALGGSAAATE